MAQSTSPAMRRAVCWRCGQAKQTRAENCPGGTPKSWVTDCKLDPPGHSSAAGFQPRWPESEPQQKDKIMFKQICFFRKRPDMSMEEFMDYYENQHSQLSKRMGRSPSIPNAVRYVR